MALSSIILSPRTKKILWWVFWIILGLIVVIGLGICCWLGYRWTKQRLNRINKELSTANPQKAPSKGHLPSEKSPQTKVDDKNDKLSLNYINRNHPKKKAKAKKPSYSTSSSSSWTGRKIDPTAPKSPRHKPIQPRKKVRFALSPSPRLNQGNGWDDKGLEGLPTMPN